MTDLDIIDADTDPNNTNLGVDGGYLVRAYGEKGPPLWYSAREFDGGEPMLPRRVELTGDGFEALMADMTVWADWLVTTFRLAARIPPCWPQHPALVEEIAALFFMWQHCWIPAKDPQMPVVFLRELDFALSRIERYWKPACTTTEHTEPTPVRYTTTGLPELRQWWSNPEHDYTDTAVPAPRDGGTT